MNKNKTKLALQRHLYSPELNTLHVIRNDRTVGIIPASGNTNFNGFFKKAKAFVKNAVVTFQYSSNWSDRTYSGRFADYKSLKKVLAELKSKHNLADRIIINIKSGWI